MRISDCSSDVCSSDLTRAHARVRVDRTPVREPRPQRVPIVRLAPCTSHRRSKSFQRGGGGSWKAATATTPNCLDPPAGMPCLIWRSEEHTSELQSLMRISYAVFCLKKKKE